MSEKIWKVGVPLVAALFALWFFFGGASDEQEEARIRAMLDEAVVAWEAKELDPFMGFFGKNFQSRSGTLTYGSLLLFHRNLFGSDATLEAELTDIEVRVKGETAIVTFDGRARGTRASGTPIRIVGKDAPAPIMIELERISTGGGLSHTWKAISSTGLEEDYGESW